MIHRLGHGKLTSTVALLSTTRGRGVLPVAVAPHGHSLLVLAKLASYTLVGIDATPVEVEVDVSFSSMPKTVLVGLAETAVNESTHRVERAIVN